MQLYFSLQPSFISLFLLMKESSRKLFYSCLRKNVLPTLQLQMIFGDDKIKFDRSCWPLTDCYFDPYLMPDVSIWYFLKASHQKGFLVLLLWMKKTSKLIWLKVILLQVILITNKCLKQASPSSRHCFLLHSDQNNHWPAVSAHFKIQQLWKIWPQCNFEACVCYFSSNFYFLPNDSPSKTMKNIFYFI